MKFYLMIDETKEPSVTIVCPKVTSAVTKIESLCKELDWDEEVLYVYADEEILPLCLTDIACFFTKDNKVFASMGDKEYATKLRIKQVLELVDDSFIKINQGCVGNVKHIEKFTVTFGGALKVVFKNGYSDYVSRRELKNIKRRLGL
jgi:DNA-binding LytR/AlgR family response regulator